MAVIGLCLVQRRRTGERALSFGARPWCDVPAAASNFKPAPRGSRGAGAAALAVSREETQHSSLLRVRVVPRWLWPSPCQRTLRRQDTPPLRRAAVVRRASCGLQFQASAAWLARRRRVGARCLWGGDAALELALRARAAALAVIGSCLVERFRTGEMVLSRGARPWCDVPAATSNFKPAPRVSRGTGAAALAISGMEAQHSSLLRVRAVPRSMWSVFTLSKGAATARCFSPSAQNRGATCQLWPQTSSQRRVARAAQARRRSLSLGRRRSTRACFACAWCRAGCDRFVSRRKMPHRRDGSLFWRAAVV